MAVTRTDRVYEGLLYTFVKGIDSEGNYVEYIEEGTPYANGLVGVFEPDEQRIIHTLGQKGKIAYMVTSYHWYLQDSEGNMIEGTAKKTHPLFGILQVRTNPWDEKDFTMFFGPKVAQFRQNGVARRIFGQKKTNRPYNDDGTVNVQTEEQKTELRTNLYDFNDIAPEPPQPESPALAS